MIHYGTTAIPEAHSQNVVIEGKETDKTNRLMETIYLDKIKQVKPRFSRKQLNKLLTYNKYMSPMEAIELGLADEVLE